MDSDFLASPDLNTVGKLVRQHSRIRGSRCAMREKDLGIWQSYSWSDVWRQVQLFAYGLRALGFGSGEHLLLVGENRPQLYWAMMAAQSLRCVPIPIYQDALPEDIVGVVESAEASFAVVENQEYVDKILAARDASSGKSDILRTIIYEDARGMRDYDIEGLYSFEAVLAMGAEARLAEPDFLDACVDSGSADDIAIIPYTSGTTGKPKGVVLNYRNLLETALHANAFDNLTEDEEVISYLPMAWVGDIVFTYAQAVVAGFTINCPESQDTLLTDMRDIGPSYFFAPPRVFENLLTNVTIRMHDASVFKRWLFDHFIRFAERVGPSIMDKRPVAWWRRLYYQLGRYIIYEPLKDALGLSKVRVGYTAGEAIGPEIFKFYRSLGINLKQLYGQTEASVYIAQQPDGEIYNDTVGPACPWVDVKIDERGELLYRSVGVFREYYRNEEGTRETKTEDGWVHSGDAAKILDNGHIKIIDRARDVGRLNGGALFAPKYIENKLKFFADIKEAVVFGDGRDYVVAFVNIDLQPMSVWAEREGVVYSSYQELASQESVADVIEKHVRQVNESLRADSMEDCCIRRFCILPKDLDADDGELTRTRKVRRSTIDSRYKALIDALYGGDKDCALSLEITFEDGHQGRLQGQVAIRDL